MKEGLLGQVLSFKSGDLVYHVPISVITAVSETPDHEWFLDVTSGETFKISQPMAVYLLGVGTIMHGPRPWYL